MTTRYRTPLRAGGLIVGLVVAFLAPAGALAHAELETSTPADGATVESPFVGPIVLAFTEALGTGSEAELRGPGDATVDTAKVDGPAATMTFTLDAALDPGEYEVRWTGVAEDGHVERGTVGFTVIPAPPTPEPTPSPSAAPTASPSSPPPSVEPSASANPSPSVDGGGTEGAGDALLPIVVALIVVGAGAVYLLTRQNRPTQPG